MSVHIAVDARESALWAQLTQLKTANHAAYDSVQLVQAGLLVGDVELRVDGEQTVSVLERKTVADLLASIRDGRYEEQSARLAHSANLHRHHVVYLIEGDVVRHKEASLVYSTVTSLLFKKGFSVMRTSSTQDSAAWLLQAARKLVRDKGVPLFHLAAPVDASTAVDYAPLVKKQRRDNVTVANIGEIMLSQIPNVSVQCARDALARAGGTVPALVRALERDRTFLADLAHVNDQGVSRRHRKDAVVNLVSYLVPVANDEGEGAEEGAEEEGEEENETS